MAPALGGLERRAPGPVVPGVDHHLAAVGACEAVVRKRPEPGAKRRRMGAVGQVRVEPAQRGLVPGGHDARDGVGGKRVRTGGIGRPRRERGVVVDQPGEVGQRKGRAARAREAAERLVGPQEPAGGHLDPEVEDALGHRTLAGSAGVDGAELDLADPEVQKGRAQAPNGGLGLGQVPGAEDHEARADPVGPDVAPVAHEGRDAFGQAALKARGVALLDQHLLGEPVALAPPGLVSPAEVEGEVDLGTRQERLHGRLHEPPAPPAVPEPVVVDAERIDPRRAGERGLLAHHLRPARVVEAQGRGQGGLGMALEERARAGAGGPLGVAAAPPGVGFGRAVEPRQVEGRNEGGARQGLGLDAGRGRGVDLGGLADRHARGGGHEPHRALEGVGERAVELRALDLELLRPQVEPAHHAQHDGLDPEHGAGRKAQRARVDLDLQAAQKRPDPRLVHAPPRAALVSLPVGDPERRVLVGEKGVEPLAHAAGLQKPRDQVAAPHVAVPAMRRALGVDLAHRAVGAQQPRVHQVHEGQDVAPAVGHAHHARLGPFALDARVELARGLAALGHRHEEVEAKARGPQRVADLVPKLGVEDVDHGGEVRARRPLGRAQRRRALAGLGGVDRGVARDAPLAVAVTDVVDEGRGQAVQVGVLREVGLGREGVRGAQPGRLAEEQIVAFGKGAVERIEARIGAEVEGPVEVLAAADGPDAPDGAGVGRREAGEAQAPPQDRLEHGGRPRAGRFAGFRPSGLRRMAAARNPRGLSGSPGCRGGSGRAAGSRERGTPNPRRPGRRPRRRWRRRWGRRRGASGP